MSENILAAYLPPEHWGELYAFTKAIELAGCDDCIALITTERDEWISRVAGKKDRSRPCLNCGALVFMEPAPDWWQKLHKVRWAVRDLEGRPHLHPYSVKEVPKPKPKLLPPVKDLGMGRKWDNYERAEMANQSLHEQMNAEDARYSDGGDDW